jgi:hypothetical protein
VLGLETLGELSRGGAKHLKPVEKCLVFLALSRSWPLMSLRVNAAIKSVSLAAPTYHRPTRHRRLAPNTPTINLAVVTNSIQAAYCGISKRTSCYRSLQSWELVVKERKPNPSVCSARFLSVDDNAANVRRPLVIPTCLLVVLDLHFEVQKILPDGRVEDLNFVDGPVVNVAEDAQRKGVKPFQELRQIICANFFLGGISSIHLRRRRPTIFLSFGHGPSGTGNSSYLMLIKPASLIQPSSFWHGQGSIPNLSTPCAICLDHLPAVHSLVNWPPLV